MAKSKNFRKDVKEEVESGSASRTSNRKDSKGKRRPKYRSNDRSIKTDVTTGEPFREFKNSKDGHNDAAWYAKNPQLLADAASFSYNTALGSAMGWNFDVDNSVGTGLSLNPNVYSQSYSLPGVMVLAYANYPGISKDRSSAINIAAENIYSYVRHTNSGHANYDAPDLMMYLVAMDSLYSFIAYCRRVYGTARLFNQKNYYFMKALVKLQGVDFDDLMANMSDFRAFINTMSAKASAFAVPSSMPIMQRHFFMASNVYKDRDTEKSQMYIFVPQGFHIYDETPSVSSPYDVAGGCVFKPLPYWNSSSYPVMTVSQLISYGNAMLDALLSSEDIGIMSGDVLKAFQGNIFTIPSTPEDYIVMPVFNPEVLSQIQNATVAPSQALTYIRNSFASEWHALDVLQDPNTNTIVANLSAAGGGTIDVNANAAGSAAMVAGSKVISFNVDHPTPADTMVGTRLTQGWHLDINGATAGGSTPMHFTLETIGTEIILQIGICEILANGLTGIDWIRYDYAIKSGSDLPWLIARNWVLVSNFNNHPTLLTGLWADSSNLLTMSPFGVIGDMDTYRVLTRAELDKINQTALLSLYGVPALGTY